jgi:hypothetical protein
MPLDAQSCPPQPSFRSSRFGPAEHPAPVRSASRAGARPADCGGKANEAGRTMTICR